MRRTRTPTKLTQNTYNGKAIGVTNAPTRLAANGCWGLGEITTAIKNGSAALEETSTWPPNHLIVEYLVIAGGGGGVMGAGGAGGKVEGTDGVITLGEHACTIGAGGDESAGTESSIGSLYTAEGGGQQTTNGGSGGGGYYTQGSYGEGIAGQGNDGGQAAAVSAIAGGGGGGAGGAGQQTQNQAGLNRSGGDGGIGEASSISGSSVTYCGGGGGGSYNQEPGEAAAAGGGGDGAAQGGTPTNGTANTGGGGGGAVGATKGLGGSGVIIVRYKGDRVLDGGTEATTGDYKLHTFNSTANLGLGFAGS